MEGTQGGGGGGCAGSRQGCTPPECVSLSSSSPFSGPLPLSKRIGHSTGAYRRPWHSVPATLPGCAEGTARAEWPLCWGAPRPCHGPCCCHGPCPCGNTEAAAGRGVTFSDCVSASPPFPPPHRPRPLGTLVPQGDMTTGTASIPLRLSGPLPSCWPLPGRYRCPALVALAARGLQRCDAQRRLLGINTAFDSSGRRGSAQLGLGLAILQALQCICTLLWA